MKMISIGELARRSGVNVRSLRHYEQSDGGLDQRIEALQQIRASAAARLAFLEEQRRGGGP